MAKANPDDLTVRLNVAGELTLKTTSPALPIERPVPLCHPGVGTLADGPSRPLESNQRPERRAPRGARVDTPATRRASAMGAERSRTIFDEAYREHARRLARAIDKQGGE